MKISLDGIFSLKGHVCIVTGGSRGIGRSCADFVAAAGADIAIIGTREDTAKQAAAQIAEEYGVRTLGIACHVEDRTEVMEMVEQVHKQLGLPDLLFNNAGICEGGDSEDFPEELWRKVLDVNLTGAFFVMQAVGKKLLSHKRPGSFVNTTSINTTVSCTPQHEAAYNASKAGLLMLCKSLAVEWGERGIRVNCISPGYILTDMIKEIGDEEAIRGWAELSPIKKVGEGKDIGGAVVYLLSDASQFTTGAELMIDGAYTLI
jgi:NAD(P)-dependent dehydrogenase (short-subunit alcohol dehydrogenase family)